MDLFRIRVLVKLLDSVQRELDSGALSLQDIRVTRYEVRVNAFRYLDALASRDADVDDLNDAARWLSYYASLGMRDGVVAEWRETALGLWRERDVDVAVQQFLDTVPATRAIDADFVPLRVDQMRAAFTRWLTALARVEAHAVTASLDSQRAELLTWRSAVGPWLDDATAAQSLQDARDAAAYLFWSGRATAASGERRGEMRRLFASWSAVTPLSEQATLAQRIEALRANLARLSYAESVPFERHISAHHGGAACVATVSYIPVEHGVISSQAAGVSHEFVLWHQRHAAAPRHRVWTSRVAWPTVSVRRTVSAPGSYWYEVRRLDAAGVERAYGRTVVGHVTVSAHCMRTHRDFNIDDTGTLVEWQTTKLPETSSRATALLSQQQTHRRAIVSYANLLSMFRAVIKPLETLDYEHSLLARAESREWLDEISRALHRRRALSPAAPLWLNLQLVANWRIFIDDAGTLDAETERRLAEYEPAIDSWQNAYMDIETAYVQQALSDRRASSEVDDVSDDVIALRAIRALRELSLTQLCSSSSVTDARVRLAARKFASTEVWTRRDVLLGSEATWRGVNSERSDIPDAYVVQFTLTEGEVMFFPRETAARMRDDRLVGEASVAVTLRRGSVRVDDSAYRTLVEAVENAWAAFIAKQPYAGGLSVLGGGQRATYAPYVRDARMRADTLRAVTQRRDSDDGHTISINDRTALHDARARLGLERDDALDALVVAVEQLHTHVTTLVLAEP